jgi:hypothetical protein
VVARILGSDSLHSTIGIAELAAIHDDGFAKALRSDSIKTKLGL